MEMNTYHCIDHFLVSGYFNFDVIIRMPENQPILQRFYQHSAFFSQKLILKKRRFYLINYGAFYSSLLLFFGGLIDSLLRHRY